jgi:hypothetical protein
MTKKTTKQQNSEQPLESWLREEVGPAYDGHIASKLEGSIFLGPYQSKNNFLSNEEVNHDFKLHITSSKI